MKVCVIGPAKAGKTTLVNYLSQQNHESNSLSTNPNNTQENKLYIPTVGCRIVEVESFQSLGSSSKNIVEFWDVAGDCQNEITDFILDDCDGVIFMYNPLNTLHRTQIETWHEMVMNVVGDRIDNNACLVLMHYDAFDGKTKEETKPPFFFRKYNTHKSYFSTRSDEMENIIHNFLRQIRQKK